MSASMPFRRPVHLAIGEPPASPSGAGWDPSDAACVATSESGSVLASCSLWWSRTPQLAGSRTGLIGHYSAADAQAGVEMLAAACSMLAARGCAWAIGPVDGSTWNNYRFVTERGAMPRFFLEPWNDDAWPLQWQRAGFRILTRYRSALQGQLTVNEPRLAALASRIAESGIRVRCIDTRRFDDELERMHAIVVAGFRDSPFFTPITSEEFVARHRSLLPCIQPELVLMAERGREPLALLFALPDLGQAQRGLSTDTAIVKTTVARPGREHAGIAHLLAARAAAIARELGYRHAIHALMRESIQSSNWSARLAHTVRRYAVFARPLGSR